MRIEMNSEDDTSAVRKSKKSQKNADNQKNVKLDVEKIGEEFDG